MPIFYVPDTNTFSLNDVITLMRLYGDWNHNNESLHQCLVTADYYEELPAFGYDERYEGDRDRLSNFRGAGITPA